MKRLTKDARREKYLALFRQPLGQEVLTDLMAECRLHRNAFNPDNARATDFSLGKQSIAQYITETLEDAAHENP